MSIDRVIAWEALIAYDTTIFVFIVYRTWTTHRDYASRRIQIPLLNLILRDGIIYYAVMVLANLANVLTFYVGDKFCAPSGTVLQEVQVISFRMSHQSHDIREDGIFEVLLTKHEHPDSGDATFRSVQVTKFVQGQLAIEEQELLTISRP
ncbi:hypothetical protein BDQ17DRAFT_1332990 [Cyathus striatus]|nr:hypothetical protein BDQ17DRAFT_1332990 [Cyathus striatus]